MITSKSNELIKLCLEVKDKKGSRKHSLCFVETYKILKEVYNKGLLTSIFVTEEKYDQVKVFSGITINIISDSIAKALSDSSTYDGCFGICKLPNTTPTSFRRCLILDRIQDPSNLGAIVRSARAFGYNTIFTIDSVYPFSYKAIRSSMGYVFDIDFIDVDIDKLKSFKDQYSIKFVSADMSGLDVSGVEKDDNNTAIIIGNEGRGIGDELFHLSDFCVSIPMQNNVESLNASVSAGILMFILK